MRQELIFRNVARLVDLPKYSPKEKQLWTVEETQKFMDTAKEHPWYFAYVLIFTYGMRRGEALGLRWSDIDFKRELMYIRQQIQMVDGKLQALPVKTRLDAPPVSLLSTSVLRSQRALANTRLLGAIASENCIRIHRGFKVYRLAGTYPASLDLNAPDAGLYYFPQAESQGSLGACSAFATTYYAYTYEVARHKGWSTRLPNESVVFSGPKELYAVWMFYQDMVKYGNTYSGSVIPSTAFPDGTEMFITPWTHMFSMADLDNSVGGSLIDYDISFMLGGSAQQPKDENGDPMEVTVRLSIPSWFVGNTDRLIITHNGVTIDTKVIGPIEGIYFLEFKTNHFSVYSIEYAVADDDSGGDSGGGKPGAVRGPATVDYRGSIQLASEGATGWKVTAGGSYVSVDNSGKVTSKRSFIKTGSATIVATNAQGESVPFKVKVKPTFVQWLLIIFLFGWIWM